MKFICRIVDRRIIESIRRNRRIVEDDDETRFRPIIRVNSSKEIKYNFIPFRWFHIQKKYFCRLIHDNYDYL